MGYNTTTKCFTVGDQSSEPFAWITEGIDPSDSREMTDTEIYGWVDTIIAQSSEYDLNDIEERAENQPYPRYGYTTAQVFEDAESWLAFKRDEIKEDYANERDTIFQYLKDWVRQSEQ